MNKKKYLITIICILIYIFISIGQNRAPIEELAAINGVGYDIERKDEDIIEYSIPISTNIYKSSGSVTNLIFKEQGQSLGVVIQKRQEKMNKKFVQGQEKVVLISEDYARYGLKTLIDDRFRNSEVSDMAYIAICKGKSEEYLKYKVKGYSNSSEYIDGLIQNSINNNFFSDDYKFIDTYVRIGAEGRTLLLPYVELSEKGIEMTGIAIFKKDKMVATLNTQNSKILNLLKNNYANGIISLQNSPKEFIDFEAKSGTRKVKCSKHGDKYSFNIDISLTGTSICNEMYSDMLKDINIKKQFEKDMAKSLEKQCNDFIKIMKQDYKIDCIDLGREAAAKFGRQKNINWNEVISDSDISVNIKVKVDLQGRGDY